MKKLKEKFKNGRTGITLISLVITIIVLLILAGVTIATLTGENGILTRANDAKEKTEQAAKDEKQDITETENIIDDYIPLTKKIKSENYGDYINYNVDLNDDGITTNDWKIFYNSGSNIFIIASEYLSNHKLPQSTDMEVYSMYSVYWPTPEHLTKAGAESISEIISNKYMLSWKNHFSKSTNDNIKAVASLLDTNTWRNFASGISGAEAVGCPTIEMYIASWNAKGYTKLYCDNFTSTGYYIGTNINSTLDGIDISSDIQGYADSLYYPHSTPYNNCSGYWIASPSNSSNVSLMAITYKGYITFGGYYDNSLASRPVVCLPNNVHGTLGTEGIWTINI